MRIIEEEKLSGYFWLPSHPEIQISGLLLISDGGVIRLEIIGSFDKSTEDLNELNTIPRIVGNVEKLGFVTLDNCIYKRKAFSFGGVSKSEIYVGLVMAPVRYEQDEVAKFDSFMFSIEGLDEWLNTYGIKVNHDWKEKTVAINYTLPKEHIISLNNKMQLKFIFDSVYTCSSKTTASIKQKSYIELSYSEPKKLKFFISVAYKLVNFISFATDQTVAIKDVSSKYSELFTEDSSGKKWQVPIKIFYESKPFSKDISTDWYSMLFDFPQVKDNIQTIINKWLDAYETIEPALNLYFSSKLGDHKYLEGRFLALAQALETYHRRTSDETLMEKTDFNDLISEIIDLAPEKYEKWLRGRLMHGNEINLKQRLKKVIEPYKGIIGSNKVREKLIRNIIDTRNYLTHYSEELESKVARGQKLYDLCLKMEVIFQLNALNNIGFTSESIELIVDENHTLQQKLDLVNWE